MVQQVFEKNRHLLRDSGVHFMDREAFYESDLRKFLSQGIYYPNGGISEDTAKESLLELTGYKDDLPISIAFVENMFGEPLYGIWTKPRPTPSLYPGFELGIKKMLSLARADFELRCMYFIRRQDEFLESLYLQCIFHGFDLTPTDYLSLLIGCDLSWNKIISCLQDVTPGGKVPIVPFELLRLGKVKYLTYILECLELMPDLSRWDLDVFENSSLSRQGLAIALAAFPHMDKGQRADLAGYLQPRFNTKCGDRFSMFSASMRAALVRRFADENISLLQDMGINSSTIVDYYSQCDE
jgi:hypothetical protein